MPDIYGKRIADAIIHKMFFDLSRSVSAMFQCNYKEKIKKVYYRHFSRRI